MSLICEDLAVTPHGKLEVLDGGRVRVRARLSRTGIQEYAPWPGAPIKDRKIRLFRPAEEVFDPVSLDTLKSSPITIYHPRTGEVTADTWREVAVGHVEGNEVKRSIVDSASDGHGEEYVETSIVLNDSEAVRRVQLPDTDPEKLREFSSGYGMAVDWTPGEYKGEKYDGIQRSIRHNHQALLRVGDARAGSEARILDSKNSGDDTVKYDELKKALADANAKIAELETKVADSADASEIEKLKTELADAKSKLADTERKLGEALAKPAATALDSAAIERQVSETIELRDSARPMLPKDYSFKGKSAGEIKLDAIKHCRPETHKALGEKPSEALVDGAFLALVADKTEYVAPKTEKTEDSGNLSPREQYLKDQAERNAKALESN